ncbi:MAG: hypothetical protein AAFY34_03550 [Pseudomonadota bacterium]
MFRRAIIASIASVALVGCGSFGFRDKAEEVEFAPIETGITTVDDIYAQFGQPHSVGKDRNGNGTVWRYYDVNRRVTGINLKASNHRVFGRITPTEIVNVDMTAYFFHADDTLWEIYNQTAPNSTVMSDALNDFQGRAGEVQEIRTEMARLAVPFDQQEADQYAWIEDVFTRKK